MSTPPATTCQRAPRRKSRRVPTLQDHLADALQVAVANALPCNRHPKVRNGNGSPLMAWMQGAPKGGSKIFAVCSGLARFPYQCPGHAVMELAKRIARRYEITHVQFDFLHNQLGNLYRCRERQQEHWAGLASDDRLVHEMRTPATADALRGACKAIGVAPHDLPLRALLSPNVTHLLLLMQLDEAISQKSRSYF